MSNRHLSRAIVLQTLFEWDFNNGAQETDTILKRNFSEFSPEKGDFSFMKGLVNGVLEKKNDLNTVIEKAAPQWPLENISIVDRNILRMGLYELLFSSRGEVPAKVAINESIELAKKFGGDKSGKFVNGVLGAVYKEIGKPGVEETSKTPSNGTRFRGGGSGAQPAQKNSKEGEIPEDQISVERLAGAVVYSRDNEGNIYLAFVHDVFGYWTLSKGRLKEGEGGEEGVIRIVKEEIGLEAHSDYYIGKNEYTSRHPEKKKIKKQVSYYLVAAPYENLELKQCGGLDDAAWFDLSSILALNIYSDVLPIITKAVNHLVGKEQNHDQHHKQQKDNSANAEDKSN